MWILLRSGAWGFVMVVVLMSSTAVVVAAEEVNLYSARKEKLIKPLLDEFRKQTGIKVNLVTGKADALLKRLESEGRNSPADLLLTTDVGRLYRAWQAGVIQPVKSAVMMAAVPEVYRDPGGYWYGLSLRARPIIYVKGKVDPQELSTYEALSDKKWHRRICIRSSGNVYNQSLMASMIASIGETKAQQWAAAFVKNFARRPTGGDRDQIKAAAAGQCDIAIVNTYYLGKMIHAKEDAQREAVAKVAIFWPNQSGRGAHVNVSGIALTKSATHQTNAIKLMEFLVSDFAQQWYGEVNHEYPIKPNIAWSDTLDKWGRFKADDVNMAILGEKNAAAVKIMDRAGWK